MWFDEPFPVAGAPLFEVLVTGRGVCQIITSGGLSGIESDSDRQYLSEVEQEEVDPLSDSPIAWLFRRTHPLSIS